MKNKFLAKLTLFSIAPNAFQSTFCLLLWRELDIPSYANPIKLVTNDVTIPLSNKSLSIVSLEAQGESFDCCFHFGHWAMHKHSFCGKFCTG